MKAYVVDVPPQEGQADDTDTREWFSSRAAASIRYSEVVKDIKADHDRNPENSEYTTVYLFASVSLDLYELPRRKSDLLAALNTQMYSCRVREIESWSAETSLRFE